MKIFLKWLTFCIAITLCWMHIQYNSHSYIKDLSYAKNQIWKYFKPGWVTLGLLLIEVYDRSGPLELYGFFAWQVLLPSSNIDSSDSRVMYVVRKLFCTSFLFCVLYFYSSWWSHSLDVIKTTFKLTLIQALIIA